MCRYSPAAYIATDMNYNHVSNIKSLTLDHPCLIFIFLLRSNTNRFNSSPLLSRIILKIVIRTLVKQAIKETKHGIFGAQKVSYTGGAYMNAHYSQVYPSQAMMPMYPLYPHYPHHHQSHTMGLPAHIFQPTSAGPMTSVPGLVSKPASIAAPNTG